MSSALLAIGISVAFGAMIALLLIGVPFWLAFVGYSLAGATAVLASAWILLRSIEAHEGNQHS